MLQRLAPSEDQPAVGRALDLSKIKVDMKVGHLGPGARFLAPIIDRLEASGPLSQRLDQLATRQGIAVRELVARFGGIPQPIDTLLDSLRQLFVDNPHLRVVILLDGLEELLDTTLPREYGLSLVDQLPEQVRLILLGHPRPEILEMLGPPQVDLDQSTAEGENDVLAFALERLERRAYLPEHQRRSAAEQVARWSGGNFLFALVTLDALERGERLD